MSGTITVNGIEHTYHGNEERSLLEFLRRDLRILSPKDGCSPQAACGCCAVELDGKVVLGCVTAMKKALGGRVRTLEGLDGRVRDAFADGFASCGGAQCGFCTPGIVMRAAARLDEDPAPSRETIEHDLRFHLCRCTGYRKIVESIECAAAALRNGGRVALPQVNGGGVGERVPKYGIRSAVLGERPYVADLAVEGMLHGALRLSDHPRARVVTIDVSKARALPGVMGVFLASDVPGQRSVGLIVPDWPLMVAEGEITRYVGDVLACVAAVDRDVAREAAALIEIDYEVLTPVTDVDEAMAAGAPDIHANGNRLSTTVVKRGDADAALKSCAHVVEGVYETQRIEHAYLEPEAALALPRGLGVKIFTQSQGIYEDRRQVALLLGLAERDVHVELVPNGGGFGGKEDLSVQGHAGLMALLLGRPVLVELSRDESIRMHPKRHPIRMAYVVGCDEKGKLQVVRSRMFGDTGAYASVGMKVLERAAGHSTGAYHVPHVDVEATALYTNNVPCGAMRGFGANQANFAMECCIDELCAAGGFDRWQFRYDNAIVEGGCTATGQRLSTGIGVRATLEAVKEAFQGAKYAGIACGIKNTGIGNGMPDSGTAKLVVRGPDHVEIHHGWTEMGQGVDTMAVQAFCEATGLSPEHVVVINDTSAGTRCGMTTASRATSLVGNSVLDACKALVADLAEHPLAELVGREYRGEWICDWTNKPGKGHGEEVTHYSYSYATQLVTLDEEGRISKITAAHDAGRIFNPTLFEGQLEGSIHMGLGYAISEELPMEEGRLKSTRLRKCGILRAREMPEMEIIGVERPASDGPYGAKGV
ncbi:MAG: selenium-dependent xanthine dehydrogenase, partial [Phycisphaerales bacterium]|nr:selenium-dependent xanthine dehydrogenase [Phycisphaerales bacterium]